MNILFHSNYYDHASPYQRPAQRGSCYPRQMFDVINDHYSSCVCQADISVDRYTDASWHFSRDQDKAYFCNGYVAYIGDPVRHPERGPEYPTAD